MTAALRQQVSDVFYIVYVGHVASGTGLYYFELLIKLILYDALTIEVYFK